MTASFESTYLLNEMGFSPMGIQVSLPSCINVYGTHILICTDVLCVFFPLGIILSFTLSCFVFTVIMFRWNHWTFSFPFFYYEFVSTYCLCTGCWLAWLSIVPIILHEFPSKNISTQFIIILLLFFSISKSIFVVIGPHIFHNNIIAIIYY